MLPLTDELIVVDEGEMLDIEVEEDLLKANEKIASANRNILDKHGVRAINVMGSVGSGKTTIIGKIVEKLRSKYAIAVIAGDVTTRIDADILSNLGVSTIQINTGRECHLDALMIRKAIKRLNLSELDLIFIENVGNLICPADFPLGTHVNLVVVSVTEGPYMIVKHPQIIRCSNVLAINKIDLADAMNVNLKKLMDDALKINPRIKVVATSAREDIGINELIKALRL